MRNSALAGLILILLFSCSDKDKLPEGILSRPKMRDVLWDMTRAGEFLNGFVFNRDSTLDKVAQSKKWYAKIYELHKITEEQFEKSFSYYNNHPLLMKELADSLSKRQVTSRPPPQQAAAGKDSTKNRLDSIKIKDTIRQATRDSLRKKIIRKKRELYKTV